MTFEIKQGDDVMAYVGDKLKAKYSKPSHAIGLTSDGKFIAGFVFTGATPHDIEASAVMESGHAIPRRFFKFLTEYCFEQLGLSRVSATTEQTNVAQSLERFGFVKEGMKRHAYGKDRHGMIYGLYAGEELVK
jgi:RimJ/RimL family protein N-acetyltransferase